MSAVISARSTRRTEGVDAVRALQRVLYRCAKRQPERRFHDLFDKVARSDVLSRAWVEVRTSRGAPASTASRSVMSRRLGSLRFSMISPHSCGHGPIVRRPLRRVHVPKPGRPGQTRPLGIPTQVVHGEDRFEPVTSGGFEQQTDLVGVQRADLGADRSLGSTSVATLRVTMPHRRPAPARVAGQSGRTSPSRALNPVF